MSDDLSGDMLAPSWPNLVYYGVSLSLSVFSPPTLYLLLCDTYLEADSLTHAPLCFVCQHLCVCVYVCTLKVNKGYQDVFISFH